MDVKASSQITIAKITGTNGIKNTEVTYQAGDSSTVVPTGTWSETIPETNATTPYLWTRTVITYTDETSSTSYSVSVSSVPEGLESRITNAETNISSNRDEINLRATKTELYSGLAEYKQAGSSELQVTADGIKLDVANLSTLYDELRMNYDFTAEGQIIGKPGSETMMKLMNSMLQILISGNPVTTLDTDGLTADMANIEVLRIGDYSLTKGIDGHLRII